MAEHLLPFSEVQAARYSPLDPRFIGVLAIRRTEIIRKATHVPPKVEAEYAVMPYGASTDQESWGLLAGTRLQPELALVHYDSLTTDAPQTTARWMSTDTIRTLAWEGAFLEPQATFIEAYEARQSRITSEENYVAVGSTDGLRQLLKDNNIFRPQWESDGTLHELMEDVSRGDSTLHQTERGLLQYVSPAMISVYYTDPESGKILELYEVSQTYYKEDGTIDRVKNRTLKNSLGEKRRVGISTPETPYQAAMRGLAEELQVTSPALLRATGSAVQPPRESYTYPGILTEFHPFYFAAVIDSSEYRPHYQENIRNPNGQVLRQTIHTWREAPSGSAKTKAGYATAA
jgi:hypothetical protein